jgi:hypothetical protein
MKKILIAALTAGLVTALVVPGSVATAAKKKAKIVKLASDPAGDWGANVATELAPIGDALGQDIVSASMGADTKNLNFVIGLNSLPPSGGMPEVSRYQWAFNVNGNAFELDGKYTNYSRGACDPTSGQCPPPRDPGMQPFMLRGNCVSGTVVTCEELGFVKGTFDAGKATITIPVPLKMIKAKARSKVIGGTITTTPAAFFTANAGPADTLTITKIYRLPRKR